MGKLRGSALMAGAAMLLALPAYAEKVVTVDPNNLAPPSGAIIDLSGDIINFGGYTLYEDAFLATASSTTFTFLFRDDPGYIAFDDASVTTGGGPNLLANPGFETGDLTGWNFLNSYGAGYSGFVGSATNNASTSLLPNSGSYFWVDGSTQAYDALDQVIATTVGDIYLVSFYTYQQNVTGGSPNTLYQQISTNGEVGGTNTLGNGDDILVYESGSGPPPPTVPEPSTWLMMLVGFAGLGYAGYRKAKSGTTVRFAA